MENGFVLASGYMPDQVPGVPISWSQTQSSHAAWVPSWFLVFNASLFLPLQTANEGCVGTGPKEWGTLNKPRAGKDSWK